MQFAKREGRTHMTVVNLFAYRATDPSELVKCADPIGPENDQHISQQVLAHKHGLIVAAWGANPFARERAKEVLLRHGPFDCLGTTKAGMPKHPLYVKGDQPLMGLKNFL